MSDSKMPMSRWWWNLPGETGGDAGFGRRPAPWHDEPRFRSRRREETETPGPPADVGGFGSPMIPFCISRVALNHRFLVDRRRLLRPVFIAVVVMGVTVSAAIAPFAAAPSEPPRRVLIETDAGGDPDDEQSLVRFLLYANEWDVIGIIANRAHARDGENRNPERTGLGIVHRLLDAYARCWTNLASHDARYPAPDVLRQRTVPGYDDTGAAVDLIVRAVDDPDPRPVWYSDWGTDHGGATNNLRRALDRVLRERGPTGYRRFKSRLRLVSADAFGPHTIDIDPPFPLWVDTWRPEWRGQRWYHRFSALTAHAGGFDLVRDCLTRHGALGALYPTNTTFPQKEGDTLSFLYLVPNGVNAPDHPDWGGWGGRLGHQDEAGARPYFWSNQQDTLGGTTTRDNTLRRWAADLQNDFRARLDWCVRRAPAGNHPPQARVRSDGPSTITPGETRTFTAVESTDPDGDALDCEWIFYPEAGAGGGGMALATIPAVENQGQSGAEPGSAPRGWDTSWIAKGPELELTGPPATHPESFHIILRVTDHRDPPLSRYRRIVLTGLPAERAAEMDPRWARLEPFFTPPPTGNTGTSHPTNPGIVGTPPTSAPMLRAVQEFQDGRSADTPAGWCERRAEIRASWDRILGAWPPLLRHPKLEILHSGPREDFTAKRVRVEIAPADSEEGWLLIPPGPGPFPAVLVVFYDPETSVGLNPNATRRDFALELTRRGFVTLSIGSPGGDARLPALNGARCQPLSFLAYVAANCWQALADLPEVDPNRIGVTGHSYGGKWALFAAALWDRFAAVAVSDPGIVFDEKRPNVNYWEPWYLGLDPERTRRPGLVTTANPRAGAYARLVREGRDLHELEALISPRPFLVSGGSEDTAERWEALRQVAAVNALLGRPRRVGLTTRSGHDPTAESNNVLYTFFEVFLAPRAARP